MFHFKQFSIDQSNCAMKINTDGVLLGAMVVADEPETILDIGTGTGVIALMLAQRFNKAKIDAVEIDGDAAGTAEKNFKSSPFEKRISIYASGFEDYFEQFPQRKYGLIVSNPPFYVGSLKSPGLKKALAKHTDADFFEKLINDISGHLTSDGRFWLILPVSISDTIITLAARYSIYPEKIISIQSYQHFEAHRTIICFGLNEILTEITNFTIYKTAGEYSEEYKKLLQPYFLAL